MNSERSIIYLYRKGLKALHVTVGKHGNFMFGFEKSTLVCCLASFCNTLAINRDNKWDKTQYEYNWSEPWSMLWI